jgi:hypothetical protein
VPNTIYALAMRQKQAYMAKLGRRHIGGHRLRRHVWQRAEREQSPMRKVNGGAEDLTTVGMLIVIVMYQGRDTHASDGRLSFVLP